MHTHFIVHQIILYIVDFPPQVPQKASLIIWNLYLVKHSLYITHEGYFFWSESQEYFCQLIG